MRAIGGQPVLENERSGTAMLWPIAANIPGAAFRYCGSFSRGRIEFVSPAVEEIVGYTPREIQALTVENLLLPWLSPHQDHGPDYIDDVRRRYALGKPMQAVHRATTKHGMTRWIMLSSRPIEEYANGEFQLDGIVTDITAQIEREQRLKETLSRYSETKESFAKFTGGVVHDLNNYIGVARVFADLIFEATELDTVPNKYAVRIIDACHRSAHVINRMRSFAQGESADADGVPTDGKMRNLMGNECILLVDDEVALADGLATALGNLGYEVAPVYSPTEALEAVREQPDAWDVIVTDQRMPEMEGLDLVKAVRILRPDIKSIVYSGFNEHSRAYFLRPGGADAYFQKPVSPAVIANGIRQIFDRNT